MSIFTSRPGAPSAGNASRMRTGWSWWWREHAAHPSRILGESHD